MLNINIIKDEYQNENIMWCSVVKSNNNGSGIVLGFW